MVVDLGHIMDLGMAVVARRNAIRCLGGQDLVGLGLPICPSLLCESRLKKSAAAAAAKVIGFIGGHVNKIFFPNHCPDHISQIFGNRITKGLSDQLARILDSELNLTFLVPVRGRV
jgi:hypothetical protein